MEKIVLIQCCDNKTYNDYGYLTFQNTIQYCSKYDLDYFLYQDCFNLKTRNIPLYWMKFECLKKFKASNYDYLWVLDIDSVINNHEKNIRNIIKDYDNRIIVSENGPNGGAKINSGSVIYRKDFIETVLIEYQNLLDNNFNLVYHLDEPFLNEISNKYPGYFSILDYNFFNSGFQGMKITNLIFHFMARSNNEKHYLIKLYFDFMKNTLNDKNIIYKNEYIDWWDYIKDKQII